ncbi:hypothetical protein I7I51_05187 [Histoplasma capsulatum]|uniref:Uncharacterized protein n=1 Tax=Ajellomyces capsulatus TaxID=5037 RepID=A0A8A1M2T6_AJECA|nr:hypothetical protein I7I51_05187 [Histoplasma capsulatum]
MSRQLDRPQGHPKQECCAEEYLFYEQYIIHEFCKWRCSRQESSKRSSWQGKTAMTRRQINLPIEPPDSQNPKTAYQITPQRLLWREPS